MKNTKKELPAHIYDETNGIHYTLYGDYYLPDLMDNSPADYRTYGKWGQIKLNYLKKHKPTLYNSMLLSGTLHEYLSTLDQQARERHQRIVDQMVAQEGITEQLKGSNQMEWVRRMNAIRDTADELILHEMIFD